MKKQFITASQCPAGCGGMVTHLIGEVPEPCHACQLERARASSQARAFDEAMERANAHQLAQEAIANGKAFAVVGEKGIEPLTMEGVMQKPDPGAHYRHVIRAAISDEDIARGYTEVKLDPYRVAEVYAMRGGPREQILKKCLRFTDKGQSEEKVIAEIESALVRWKQMRDEDRRVPCK